MHNFVHVKHEQGSCVLIRAQLKSLLPEATNNIDWYYALLGGGGNEQKLLPHTSILIF